MGIIIGMLGIEPCIGIGLGIAIWFIGIIEVDSLLRGMRCSEGL
jgi:hypothetical protein